NEYNSFPSVDLPTSGLRRRCGACPGKLGVMVHHSGTSVRWLAGATGVAFGDEVRRMVRRFRSSPALVVVLLALAVAVFPTTAPSQSLEDILFQAFEITAQMSAVPVQVTCNDPL